MILKIIYKIYVFLIKITGELSDGLVNFSSPCFSLIRPFSLGSVVILKYFYFISSCVSIVSFPALFAFFCIFTLLNNCGHHIFAKNMLNN